MIHLYSALCVVLVLATAHAAKDDPRVACYYTSWAVYRPSLGYYTTEKIPEDQCTHLIYAFIGVNNNTWDVYIPDPESSINKNGFRNFTGIRNQFPDQYYHIALGGWGEGGYKLSQMVSESERRSLYIQNVIKFMEEYGFDGISLDWEYPGDTERNGNPADKEHYLAFVKELRAAFDQKHKNWEITVEGAVEKNRIDQGYNIPELCKIVDAIYVKSFDLRGYWTGFADVPNPLFRRPHDIGPYETKNVNESLQLWEDEGCPANKLVVGIGLHGRTYTLSGISYAIGTPIKGVEPGKQGPYTREYGYIAYFEICPDFNNPKSGWGKKWDDIGKCPYMYKDDQWIGYEDEESIQYKVSWLKEKGYAGAFIFSLDMDDFNGLCGAINPLVNTLRANFLDYKIPNTNSRSESCDCGTAAVGPDKSRDGYELKLGIGYYKYHGTPVTWNEARKKCAEEDAHLVVLNSQEEVDTVTEMFNAQPKISTYPVWAADLLIVGFHDLFVEGDYVTVQDRPLDKAGYLKWGPNEPNGGSSLNCGNIDRKGFLLDNSCKLRQSFICERDL